MRSSRRTLLAVAITVAAAVIGMTAWTLDRVDPGMTFGMGTDAQGRNTLTVGSVTPGGLAWYEGVHSGDVVINVGGIQTLPGDQAVLEAYANSQESQSALITVPPAQLQEALANGGWGSPPLASASWSWAGGTVMRADCDSWEFAYASNTAWSPGRVCMPPTLITTSPE